MVVLLLVPGLEGYLVSTVTHAFAEPLKGWSPLLPPAEAVTWRLSNIIKDSVVDSDTQNS